MVGLNQSSRYGRGVSINLAVLVPTGGTTHRLRIVGLRTFVNQRVIGPRVGEPARRELPY